MKAERFTNGNPTGNPEVHATTTTATESEFANFERLAAALLSVPKDEIDAERAKKP